MLACADNFPAPELQVVICTLARGLLLCCFVGRYLLLQVRGYTSGSIYAYRTLPEVWCPCLVPHTCFVHATHTCFGHLSTLPEII